MRNIMNKRIAIALLALPLCAAVARANNTLCISMPSCAYRVEAGANVHFRILPLEPNASQLGPWYLYWPMEAHFVTPAPIGYPYWPSPMTLPNMALGGPGSPAVPPHLPGPAVVPAIPQPPAPPAPALRPASCSVPAYWYDR
jgi:hypothetical protein